MTPTAFERRLERLETARSGPTPGAGDFTAYRDSPVAFVREVLGGDPWAKQEEILEALATRRRVSVRSAHSVGKTWLAARAVLWFLQTRPGSIVVTTAPTWHQVKDLLWREIRSAFVGAQEPLLGACRQAELEIGDRWFARGLSTNEPVRFQGFHSSAGLLFVADEASGIDEAIYETAKGFLTQEGAHELLIGNPNFAAGSFYESQQSDAYAHFHISAQEAPSWLVSPGWIEERRQEWGEASPAYIVRVSGNFPPQGSDSLFSMTLLEAAQQRTLPEGEETVIGLDVARFGDDLTVVYVRQGDRIVDRRSWRGNDLMETAGQVVQLARQWAPQTINVDSIGVGAGVVDRLAELGLPVVGVNVGEAAIESDLYVNRRTEIFFALAARFQQGDIDIPEDDADLLSELVALRYSFTSRGQYKLESKDDLKKRTGGKSPDHADALSLTYAVSGPRWLPQAFASDEGRPAWTNTSDVMGGGGWR